jgi:PAS domain S-box-containing protein
MDVINSGNPIVDREECFLSSDGKKEWFLTSKYPLYDSGGNVKGLLGTGHDITNRKIAEQELETKNRELSFLNTLAFEITQLSLTDNINAFLARKIKEFSEASIAVSLDYIAEKKAIQIKHIETNQNIINKVSNSLGMKFFETLIPLPDGNLEFILREYFAIADSLCELSFGQVSDFADKVIKKVTGIDRFYAIANVIGGKFLGTTMLGFKEGTVAPSKEVLVAFARLAATTIQNRRSEEKLKESEEQFRLLIENQGEGVGIVDLDEKFVFVNPAAEDMFGVDQGGLLNRSLLDFVNPEQKAIIIQETRKRTNAEKSTYEIDIIRPNREQRTLLITATPQFRKDGTLSGTFGVFRDITERKIAEKELIKSKEKAEESDRLKTAFLHNISHEIRTPMNAIIGFSALLSEPDMDKESQNSFIEIITKSSNQLLSIVTDIIEISNIEAGILKLNSNQTNLNSVSGNLQNRFSPMASEKNVDFIIDTGLKDGEAQIWTDETKLSQILSCLLSNAIKFTSKGNITLGYRLKGGFIEFFVSDTGIGIHKEQFSNIFDRFYQVEHTLDRQYDGTGLGLSIAKAYVELLGGKIWLTSEPGSGTTFLFTIPYSTSEPTTKEVRKAGIYEDLKKYENKTVLIAEDEEMNYRLLIQFLSGLNLKLIHAENGKEAFDICDSNEDIDLVLMDIKMPVMDGLEATALLKKRRPSLPVIAQTAFAFESDRDKVLKSGCDDYIAKPIKKDILIAMVKKYL